MTFPTDPILNSDTYSVHVDRTNEHFADAGQHSQAVNVAAFGAVSGATATQTRQAFEAAMAYAITQNKRGVFVPSKNEEYTFDAPITLDKISIIGEERNSCRLRWPAGTVPAGGHAITILGEGGFENVPWLKDLCIFGPSGGFTGVDDHPANFHGVRCGQVGSQYGAVDLQNIYVALFDYNIVLQNASGQIFLQDVRSQYGYYGVYFRQANADYSFVACNFTNNAFAGIGMPRTTGVNMMSIWKTHFGFEPYGIYQSNAEDGNPADSQKGFMYQCDLIGVDFEAVGNGAILTEAVADGANPWAGRFFGNLVRGGWHDFNDGYKIATRNKEYYVDVKEAQFNTVDWGDVPWPPGDVGVIRYTSGHSWTLLGRSQQPVAPKVLIQGDTASNTLDKRLLDYSVTISATEPSATFTYDTWVKAAAMAVRPALIPRSDPGGRYWISTRNESGFVVTREGNTAAAVTFEIQLFT